MSGVTATDFFCGAGGSSTGLAAAGITVKHAANHWQRAIDTHSLNHPSTEHSLDDLQKAHASWYPTTDIGWFSPECTNHSGAKGRKRKNIDQRPLPGIGEDYLDPAEERSRATMREVVEFSAFHRYKVVIVENVVEITAWAHYDAWLRAMIDLGYEYKVLYLNAMFFNVPQSRDRIYVVFWQRGIKAPDLDFRPPAACPKCGPVNAVQAMKSHSRTQAKRYGTNRQYVYRCPTCYAEVRPYHVPAAAAIDWSLPALRIGDRKKPLKAKTMERIEAGLKKLGARSMVVNTTMTHATHNGQIRATDDPLATQTAQQSHALVTPLLLNNKFQQIGKSTNEPFGTVTTDDSHCLIVPPSMIVTNRENNVPRTPDEAMSVVTTAQSHMLITMRNSTPARGVDEPLTSVEAGGNHHYLLTLRQSWQLRDINEPVSTIGAGGGKGGINHALIFTDRRGHPLKPATEPITSIIAHSSQHSLISPAIAIDDCGFRMLEPHELKLAQGFPDDYIITGNKSEQVEQIGNAVCAPVAYMIAQRVVDTLMVS